MSRMTVIEISSFGGPEVLKPAEREKPKPNPGEVLIRVEAAGVSRADIMQRHGKYPPPPGASDIPGLDVAGAIARAGTPEKCEACRKLGAEHAINYKEADFVSEVKRITAERGVDVILDMVGGAYLERNLHALAVEGRLSIVATQGGRAGQLDIGSLMIKRGKIIGSTMRNRTPEQKGEVARRLLQEIWPILPAKDPIRPVIDAVFPLREAQKAHERLESGQHIGKIVLSV